MTGHLNVRGAQRFQTPSYILSPLDFGPQPSLECPFLFLLSFLSGHSETPPETAVLFLLIKLFLENYGQFPMWAAYELVKCRNICYIIPRTRQYMRIAPQCCRIT